jgi:pyruvate/2-oxoglutarate dehydrogenase complex dihydrolipoamide acyltransferase (E2) component
MKMRLKMPRLAISMEEGTLAQWLAEDGSTVTQGQAIYVVESEKSASEIPSPAAGILKHVAQVNSVYKVGEILAELDTAH